MGQYYSLDYSKLDTILKNIKNTTLDYFPYFQEAFILLYETGCRVGELFDITRWRRINYTTLGLTPQKYNSERIISIPSGVTLFPQWVDAQVVPWFGLSVVQLNALFMRYSPYTSYLAETKPVSLYLFRYRYIRYLASNGWSLADIQTIMGYSSQTVIHNYLNSALSYYAEAPVYPVISVGSQSWIASNYPVTDGGSGIVSVSNNPANDADFGLLYNHSALLRLNSSLPTLRVATIDDILQLYTFLGYHNSVGGSLKSVGTSFWLPPNTGASNSSGLDLRAAGFCNASFVFSNFLSSGYFASISDVSDSSIWCFRLVYNSIDLQFGGYLKSNYFSSLFLLR